MSLTTPSSSSFGMKLATLPLVEKKQEAKSQQNSAAPAERLSSLLIKLSYQELRRLLVADRTLGRSRPQMIDPPLLINQVALRLVGAGGLQDLCDRGDYFATLANAVRRLLMEAASETGRRALDRWQLTALSESVSCVPTRLDFALRKIEERSPLHAQVLVLRLFGGLTYSETGEQLDQSAEQVKALWLSASDWLASSLVVAPVES